MDYESMLLSNQEDHHDGLIETDDVITISVFDISSQGYVKVKTLTGSAAQEYCYLNGIY